MSIHTDKAQRIARERGGYAGNPEAADLWKMSKRELVEIALRLGEMCADYGSFENALARVREEHRILKEQGII